MLKKAFIISFVFNIVGSILNYMFVVVMGNMLTVEDFGVYNTINSLSANIAILFSPLSIIMCQITATNCNNLQKNVRKYKQIMMISVMILILISVVGILIYPWLKGRIGVKGIFDWGMVFLMTGALGLYNVLYSAIQGLSKFSIYGLVGVLVVLVKMVVSVINVYLGAGVEGVIYAMLFSYLLLAGVICVVLKKYIVIYEENSAEAFDKKEILESYGMAFFASLFYSFYVNGGEILFIGFLFDDKQVGLYSAAATLGKIVLFAISVITVVLFPTVASRKGQGIQTKAIFYKMVGFSFAFSIGYSLFLSTLGKNIILLFYGEKYRPALEYINSITIFIVPLCVLSVVHTYFLGIGRIKEYTLILGAVTIVSAAVMALAVNSISYVPVVLGIALYVVIIFAVVYVHRMKA